MSTLKGFRRIIISDDCIHHQCRKRSSVPSNNVDVWIIVILNCNSRLCLVLEAVDLTLRTGCIMCSHSMDVIDGYDTLTTSRTATTVCGYKKSVKV